MVFFLDSSAHLFVSFVQMGDLIDVVRLCLGVL